MFVCYVKTCACLALHNQILNPLPFFGFLYFTAYSSSDRSSLCSAPFQLLLPFFLSNLYTEYIDSKWMGKMTNQGLCRAGLDKCQNFYLDKELTDF